MTHAALCRAHRGPPFPVRPCQVSHRALHQLSQRVPYAYIFFSRTSSEPRRATVDVARVLELHGLRSRQRLPLSAAGKQSSQQLQAYGPSKDDYLLNLFRKEDTGYAPPELPALMGQLHQGAAAFQQQQPQYPGQPQQLSGFPSVQIPGYPGYGVLPQHNGRPAARVQQSAPNDHGLSSGATVQPDQVKIMSLLCKWECLQYVCLRLGISTRIV